MTPPSPPRCLLTRLLVLHVTPQPLFPFQSFTKNFFSSFYNFFFPPNICSSITRPGNGRPGESCDLHSGCCLGEEKGSVCQNPFFGPAGRSGVNSTLIQSVQATEGPAHFYPVLALFLLVLTLSSLSSLLLLPLVRSKCQGLRLTVIKYAQKCGL